MPNKSKIWWCSNNFFSSKKKTNNCLHKVYGEKKSFFLKVVINKTREKEKGVLKPLFLFLFFFKLFQFYFQLTNPLNDIPCKSYYFSD